MTVGGLAAAVLIEGLCSLATPYFFFFGAACSAKSARISL